MPGEVAFLLALEEKAEAHRCGVSKWGGIFLHLPVAGGGGGGGRGGDCNSWTGSSQKPAEGAQVASRCTESHWEGLNTESEGLVA